MRPRASFAIPSFVLPALGLALLTGCEPDPCSDYVDYMCDCHDGDGDVSCQTYENTYANADADLQDECAIALEDQIDEDDANGVECASDTTAEQ
ncbi:MAG: hypothetical protein H6742_01675 [Alphaproteobacteria bacterium]|nr:hypothetical protein [Alphaproteobacteria bacterium]